MLGIKIILDKREYNLGEPLPITAIYSNAGLSAVKMEDPSKSLNVEMHVIDLNNQEDLNYTMGKIETTQFGTDVDEYAIIEPIPGEIEIDANGDLSFVTDLNQQLYLYPGKFKCELRDGVLVSNHEIMTIEYTLDSVDVLFSIVKDANLDYSRREWAANWLHEIAPEFEFKLTLDPEPDEVKRQNELANDSVYDAFTKWWAANRDSEEVAIKLESINQMAQ